MKKGYRVISALNFILLVFMTGEGYSFAPSPQQAFEQANSLYQKHRYDSALTLYRNLIGLGYTNSELYYNTGNASFKSGQLGYAVYYFEKALQQSPGNKVIQHNLALAKQQATDKIDQVPTLFFIRWWQRLLHLHTANGWMAGSILFFWLLVFFIGWRLLRRRASVPRWSQWAIAVSAILFCLYFSGAAGTWYQRTHHLFAVIVQPDEALKSAPDAGSTDVLEVHEGLKVKILDSVDTWRKIRLTDGKEGWVREVALLAL